MISYLDCKKAANLMGCSGRHVRGMCGRGLLHGAIKEGSRWKIPRTAHLKLADVGTPQNLANSAELLGVPAVKRDEALRKLGLVQELEKFVAEFTRNNGNRRARTEALEIFTSQRQIPKRSLQRWQTRYHKQGLIGLVDTRGGGRFLAEMISPEAFELFKSMFLTQQQLTVKTCWQNINYYNNTNSEGWTIPGLQFMYKYIKSQIPLPVQVLHREGLSAYKAKCAPYIQVDYRSILPGEIWVGDHHQYNCWIRHRGKWVRPWITAWADMKSRSIVGRHISTSPNQTTILLAMKPAVKKYGPPDSVKIDNGRDYDSEMWTGTTKGKRRAVKAGYIDEPMVAGIYGMMDIGISFSIPYHPQSKPLERFFDTLDCQFTKTFDTYCGKDSQRKPEHLNDLLNSEKAIAQAYDMDRFIAAVDGYIQAFNNTAHSGTGMQGRTPAEVLAARSRRRVLTDDVLNLLMKIWSRELVVGKNGVNFNKMWYGQYNTELLIHQGRKVRVAYDPDDVRYVDVYDAVTWKLITIAQQNRLVAYGSAVSEEMLRQASAAKSRSLKIVRQYRNSQLTANMDLTDLTIKAMQEGQKEKKVTEQLETLRPVKTPLDSQAAEHRRQIVKAIVKKAAGAESIKEVLNFDFEALKQDNKYENVNLWDD